MRVEKVHQRCSRPFFVLTCVPLRHHGSFLLRRQPAIVAYCWTELFNSVDNPDEHKGDGKITWSEMRDEILDGGTGSGSPERLDRNRQGGCIANENNGRQTS